MATVTATRRAAAPSAATLPRDTQLAALYAAAVADSRRGATATVASVERTASTLRLALYAAAVAAVLCPLAAVLALYW